MGSQLDSLDSFDLLDVPKLGAHDQGPRFSLNSMIHGLGAVLLWPEMGHCTQLVERTMVSQNT